ncbi:MAG: hypothetical protein GY913_02875 [Proteobacteria bacterium]|nr:hypothetical protein [Pseudomonadota bacterium]
MRRLLPHALAVATLVLSLAWVATLGVDEVVAARALRGLGGLLVVALSAVGLGGAVLRSSDLDEAAVVGLGLLVPALALAVLVGLPPGGVALVASLGALGWLRRPEVRLPDPPPAVWLLIVPIAVMAGLDALAPPSDTDEIYQHLALAEQLLADLPTGELRPDASRPLPLHLVYAGALALGGEVAPKLLHLALGLLLVLRIEAIVRRLGGASWLAVLAVVGSYTVVRELGLAYNNLPVALCVVLALDAALHRRVWRLAAFGAAAISVKYTAAPALLGVWLAYLVAGGGLRSAVLSGVAAVSSVIPWWLRNAVDGLHPLFPFTGWPAQDRFEFAYIERYGMGREWLDFLLLPWNATVHAQTDDYTFLGRISPLFLVAALPALVAVFRAGRRSPAAAVAVAALVGALGWAAGPHWLRYLLPTVPLLAVLVGLSGRALPRWGVAALGLVGLAGLPSNLGPYLEQLAPAVPVALGADPEPYLQDRVPGYTAARYCAEHLPQDAVVAVLFAWPGYYVDRPYVLSSVEDHVPARHLLYVQGDATLDALRAEGVTHVLSGRVNFIHKSYPFLSEQAFVEQFRAPEKQLSELLLAEGRLLFEDGRYGVWTLL